MRLGVHYANFTHPGGPQAITVTVMDHWFQMENLGGPADACNLFGESPEVVAHKLEDVDEFLTRMTECAAVGIELVTIVPAGTDPVAWTTRVGEDVLPRLDGI